MKKILVVGSINVDLVSLVAFLPAPGETISSQGFRVFPGGKGANQAVAAARLGAEVTFLGKTGDDSYADISLEAMNKAGVNTSYIAREKDINTGLAVIHVSSVTGENCIVITPGANEKVDPGYICSHMELLKASDIILVQLELPMHTVGYIMQTAHKLGKTVILDPAPAAGMKEELLQYATIITPNETELKQIANGREGRKAFSYLKQKGANIVINKAGGHGVYFEKNGEIANIPSFPVEVVDTTAAGDSFNAGLAFKLAQDAPMEEALEFANAVGALAVTQNGAQSAMPDYETVEQFIKANK